MKFHIYTKKTKTRINIINCPEVLQLSKEDPTFLGSSHGRSGLILCITAAMTVTNNIINALDKKEQHRAALFIDLSKAFDSVEHELLLNKLMNFGFKTVKNVSEMIW